MGIARHVDFLHRGRVISPERRRIKPRVVHTGRDGARSRVEILNLLGHISQVADVLGQRDRVLHRAARVGGHQVGHNVLVFVQLLVHFLKLAAELVIGVHIRFAHFGEHVVGDVLGRHAELSAYVILAEFTQKRPVLVCQKIVEPKTRPHKHFFDSGQRAEFAKEGQIVAVIHLEVWTGLGIETAAVVTGAFRELFVTGGAAEFRCGAADVMDVALEIGVLQADPGLSEDRLMAPALDNAALVEGQRAEVAVAETPPVGGQAEFDL